MNPIRKRLIEITAQIADEPVKAMEELENFVKEREKAAYERGNGVAEGSEFRAYSLYCAGKHFTDIIEILADEYPELDADQIDTIVNDACERFKEKDVPLENGAE